LCGKRDKTSEEQKIRLHEIATKMKDFGVNTAFIADAIKIGEIYEGAFDLFCIWDEEDLIEKEKIISVLKSEIEEYKAQVEQI
jgi:hypothetical protein